MAMGYRRDSRGWESANGLWLVTIQGVRTMVSLEFQGRITYRDSAEETIYPFRIDDSGCRIMDYRKRRIPKYVKKKLDVLKNDIIRTEKRRKRELGVA